jgi:type IV secretory pathway VirB4 component
VRSRRLKVLISALISAYAYSTLLTKVSRSVLFVDEAWMFMETPSIVGLFESVARRGRKHGVGFIYITQRAEDLARTPQGRTILEQSATVLLLRQEPEGRDAVRQIYRLSDAEAELLVAAPVGSGILKSGRRRLRVSILPTPEELEAFSTTPRGVT